MGYRTSIKNINSVGHLIEGNVYTFLEQSVSSDEMLATNIEFLDKLIRRTPEQFYMSGNYWRRIEYELEYLRHEWHEVRNEWEEVRHYWGKYRNGFKNVNNNSEQFLSSNERLPSYLQVISKLFSRCAVKSILLPGFDHENQINSLLTSEDVLKKIVQIHPGDTALILQFEEQFYKEDIAILNVFSKFDTALYQMDNWPGVFLWNNDDSIFLPIIKENELYEIFKVIRYEKNSFNYLRERFKRKNKPKNYAYLFHMSDLHFGNKLAEKRTTRVVRILEDQISKLEDDAVIIPIITGDLMESPNSSNKQNYQLFSDLLISKGFEKPIYTLGNHDVNTKGILRLLTKLKAVISSLSNSSKIEIFEKLKLAIIKFDSNTGGELAQGKIGEDQLMEIGNEIDAIKDNDSYTYIALLHHHPMEIENPSWRAKEWYESLLGSKNFEKTMRLVDADLFLEWIKKRGIKYILHGHKHIPKIQKHDNVTVIAAGSTTGSVKHQEKGKTFLSYNLIKYDIDNQQPVSVSIIAEEIIGAGTKNILLHQIKDYPCD
jgi:hypothetical protein